MNSVSVRSLGGPARRAGPLLLAAGLVAACATAGPSARGPGTPSGAGREEEPAAPPSGALDAARVALDSGLALRAAALADSLYFGWRAAGGRDADAARALALESRALESADSLVAAAERLGELLDRYPGGGEAESSARELARLRWRLAEDPGAVEVLLAHPGAVAREQVEMAGRAAREMSLPELTRLLDQAGGVPELRRVLQAELARALALAGRVDSAKDVARRLRRETSADAATAAADSVLSDRIVPDRRPLRIALLLSRSGRFARVGELLERGARVALEDYRERGGADSIELVTRDDSSSARRAGRLAGELADEGVMAILGPILSESFDAAVRARSRPATAIVSPTATDVSRAGVHALTLWSRRQREMDVAAALGHWLSGEAGLRRLAVLYPAGDEGVGRLVAFERGASRGGGAVVAAAPYDPTATTFEDPSSLVAAARPEAVYVAADRAGTVLQLAPQLSYYGLQDAVLAGGEAWSEPSAFHRLDPGLASHALIAGYLDRGEATKGPWQDFEAKYEAKYGSALRDNVLPALGHDAMMLILRALPQGGLARPAALARALGRLRDVAGATGSLTPRPERSAVSRAVHFWRVQGGELEPVAAGDPRQWIAGMRDLDEQGRAHDRALAEQAVSRKMEPQAPGEASP